MGILQGLQNLYQKGGTTNTSTLQGSSTSAIANAYNKNNTSNVSSSTPAKTNSTMSASEVARIDNILANKTTPNNVLSNTVQPYNRETTKSNEEAIKEYINSTPTTYVSTINGGNKVEDTTGTSKVSSGASENYYGALVDLLNQQLEAQENARKSQLEATKKANQQAYDQSYRDRYSAFKKNEKLINNQTKNNLSGNMLTNRLGNQLNYYNGVSSDMNTLNNANLTGETADYTTQANNLNGYYNNLLNILGNMTNLDESAYRNIIKKIKA